MALANQNMDTQILNDDFLIPVDVDSASIHQTNGQKPSFNL